MKGSECVFDYVHLFYCNQRRMIEQAKFPYSPSGKALEKQTKTIEDKGEKQIKALEQHGKQLIMSSQQRKRFFRNSIELVNERSFEINKLTEGICLNNLTYRYKDKSAPNYFIHFKGLLIIYNDITNGQKSLQKEEKIQEVFKLELSEILKGDPDYKLEDQINATKI